MVENKSQEIIPLMINETTMAIGTPINNDPSIVVIALAVISTNKPHRNRASTIIDLACQLCQAGLCSS